MAQKAVLSLLLSFGLSLNQLFSGAQILKMTHPQMAETIAPIIKDNKELQDVTSAAAESRVEGGSPARAAAESVKGPDALIQSRSQFLKQVEGLVQNPSRLTPETKQKLFQDFAELFQSPKEDLDKYKKNILAIYECQLLFLEDALEAYKQQKEFKSTKRSECEKMNGEFYFREKLITPEIQELNRQTMLSVVERKPVTVGSGESKVIDEPFLKNMIRAQKTMTESVIKIFN